MRSFIPWAALAVSIAASSGANAAEVARDTFGRLADGRTVEIVTLANAHGMKARVLTYGAILQGVDVPDRDGRIADVSLGYANMDGYLSAPNYFGATVGRYANRIRGGRFTIDGKPYQLALNDKTNALHGGRQGFDKRLWTVIEAKGGKSAHVTLGYTSADGEEGYPGTLTVRATYALDEHDALTLTYEARTTKPTIVNITNHSFWNLAGEASQLGILPELLTIPADEITPVDKTLIPTGERRPVSGTPFDFRAAATIGDRIRDGHDRQIVFGQGYDENFVVTLGLTATPHPVATLEDPRTGRVLTIASNQPGVQLYTGNFLDGTAVGKSGHAYRQSDGIALEPQVFPDTPNQPAFGSARLDPGRTYRNVIVYSFSTSAR